MPDDVASKFKICRAIIAYLGRKVAVMDGVRWRRLVACKMGPIIVPWLPNRVNVRMRARCVQKQDARVWWLITSPRRLNESLFLVSLFRSWVEIGGKSSVTMEAATGL